MAKIVVMFNDRVIKEVHVGKEPVRIGRDPTNEIHLENPAVSRFHAEIYRQGYPYFVEDKNSTNGTFLNGCRVSWKSGISDEDSITVGKHTLLFKTTGSDNPTERLMDISNAEQTMVVGVTPKGRK